MKLKIFVNMLIAALVVFIVFNLFVPMSVTVMNEGFAESPEAQMPPPQQTASDLPAQPQNAEIPPDMEIYPNPNPNAQNASVASSQSPNSAQTKPPTIQGPWGVTQSQVPTN